MSLSEQIQRVDGSQNEILKTILKAFGVTIGSEKIDGIASLAKLAANLKENGVLANDTKTAFGLGTDAAVNDVLLKAKSLIDAAQNTANGAPKIVFGSYIGTDKTGVSYANSVSSEFPMKLFWIYAYRDADINGNLRTFIPSFDSTYSMVYVPDMSTEYNSDVSFGNVDNYSRMVCLAKRSSDSKKIYWYDTTNDPGRQYNKKNYKYYYLIWG